MIQKTIAVFHPKAGAHGVAWSCADGIVSVLQAMGHRVVDCADPRDAPPPLEALQDSDLIILSGPEWYREELLSACGEAWDRLRAKKAAWYMESFERPGPRFDFTRLEGLADLHFFPALQDAERFGWDWLPFGVDVAVFNPGPAPFRTRVTRPIASIGRLHYPKRSDYLDYLANAPGFGLSLPRIEPPAGSDRQGALANLVHAYRSTGIVWNLPAYSLEIVTRVTEAMACGALVLTPLIDDASALGNHRLFRDGEHLVTYRADRPGELAATIRFLLAHPERVEEIALAGQREAAANHRLDQRLETILRRAFPSRLPGGRIMFPAPAPALYHLCTDDGAAMHYDLEANALRTTASSSVRINLALQIVEGYGALVRLNELRRIDGQIQLGEGFLHVAPLTEVRYFDLVIERPASDRAIVRTPSGALQARGVDVNLSTGRETPWRLRRL